MFFKPKTVEEELAKIDKSFENRIFMTGPNIFFDWFFRIISYPIILIITYHQILTAITIGEYVIVILFGLYFCSMIESVIKTHNSKLLSKVAKLTFDKNVLKDEILRQHNQTK